MSTEAFQTTAPAVTILRSQEEFLVTGVGLTDPRPDENCPICQDELLEDVVKIQACSHTFHCVCITTWWRSFDYNPNRDCPYCRRELYAPEPTPRPSSRDSEHPASSNSQYSTGLYETPIIEDNGSLNSRSLGSYYSGDRDGESWNERQARLCPPSLSSTPQSSLSGLLRGARQALDSIRSAIGRPRHGSSASARTSRMHSTYVRTITVMRPSAPRGNFTVRIYGPSPEAALVRLQYDEEDEEVQYFSDLE